VPALGSPEIQASFAASYSMTAWALLLAPLLAGLALEPVIFLLADRHPRRWFVCGGLFGMAACAFAAAAAPHIVVLSAAIALSYVASGTGVALAQAVLVDARPHEREKVMHRWVLMGEAGDLLAPALMAGLAAVALGWRTGYAVVGALVLVVAIAIARRPFPEAVRETDEEDEPLWASFKLAVGNRRLVFWLFGCVLCDLLDETLVVFASLHLRDVVGVGPIARSLILGASVAGGIVGLLVSERLLARVAPVRLLGLCAAACGLCYGAWLCVSSLWASAILLVLVGVFSAPLYPIAVAQAYAALPGRSGAVNAAGHLFTPLSAALPLLLGWLADTYGTGAALVVLLAEPVGLVLVASYAVRRG
jgi:MFS family permease